ncbi:uncharacterized protein VP01_437g4 [Puccinia sorghi]|uniref:Uncharacterized protein n=1 Tax=Puccinia sorghi TaxID=27349 RepID=A0A0L6UPP8_9BASI|nr:uncharacterized protein VP01_437g4 [Puccinia sorghi]
MTAVPKLGNLPAVLWCETVSSGKGGRQRKALQGIEARRKNIINSFNKLKKQKEMMAMFLQQSQSPRNIPLPEPPAQQQVPSLQFATSTPQTGRAVGLGTTIWGIEDSLLDTSVDQNQASFSRRKKSNGSEVDLFIKSVEKVALMNGAGGQDVTLHLQLMIKERKISKAIKNMEGHETSDWEVLKKELIHKWAMLLHSEDVTRIPFLN